jgi:hypothetical protein
LENDAPQHPGPVLTAATSGDGYRLEDVLELLKLVETYQPADTEDLLAQIPHWQQVLRQKSTRLAQTVFNSACRDARRRTRSTACGTIRITARKRNAPLLERLQQVLAACPSLTDHFLEVVRSRSHFKS